MALNPEVKKRIFDAADELLAASEIGEIPNVETVRCSNLQSKTDKPAISAIFDRN